MALMKKKYDSYVQLQLVCNNLTESSVGNLEDGSFSWLEGHQGQDTLRRKRNDSSRNCMVRPRSVGACTSTCIWDLIAKAVKIRIRGRRIGNILKVRTYVCVSSCFDWLAAVAATKAKEPSCSTRCCCRNSQLYTCAGRASCYDNYGELGRPLLDRCSTRRNAHLVCVLRHKSTRYYTSIAPNFGSYSTLQELYTYVQLR